MDPVVEVGKIVADFTLIDLQGRQHSLRDYRGWIVIINFWSAECPWSSRTDEKMRNLMTEWSDQVRLITIAPNANESLEFLRRIASERRLNIVLTDPDQQIVSLFGARATPHIFLIDKQGVLRYQGAFDDATFRQSNPQKHYLQDALIALMNDKEPHPTVTTPYGCAIVRYAP